MDVNSYAETDASNLKLSLRISYLLHFISLLKLNVTHMPQVLRKMAGNGVKDLNLSPKLKALALLS